MRYAFQHNLPRPMRAESTQFRTRRGNRVYKRSRVVNGQKVFADHYTLRAKQDGKTAYFHLGTSKREAGSNADEIMAFLAVEGNTLHEALERYSELHKGRAARKPKLLAQAKHSPTVGYMVERYLSVTSHLSPVTQRNNTLALRHIAAGILQLPKLGVNQTTAQRGRWRKKVDSFPIADFTIKAVEEYRQRELSQFKGNFKQQGATSTTLNSHVRSAKSVFSRKLLPLYSDLTLPDPLPFAGVYPLPEPSHRYHSEIDIAQLIESAKSSLYANNPDAWIAFLLCIGAGLRREEIDKLMWDQVDVKERRIWIKTTEFFKPKAKNSESYVDLSEGIADYIAEYRDQSPPRRFVLPGQEVANRIRSNNTFKPLMAWLREHGVSAKTPLHTLRKEAGSLVFERGGSIDKTAEFLRNDPRVAREHYIGRKERLELELPGL